MVSTRLIGSRPLLWMGLCIASAMHVSLMSYHMNALPAQHAIHKAKTKSDAVDACYDGFGSCRIIFT